MLTYLHSDHLGSTVLTTNSSGNVTGNHGYYAYGRDRYGSEVGTDHRFTGQKLDSVGLQYFNARYYDPELGQFISPDTLVPAPGNVFAYNRYLYVAGNPMRLTDSSGHVWETIADVVSVGYDIYDIANNGLTWESGASLAVDVVGAVVPFVPSAGACVRWCDEAVQVGDEALEYGSKAVNYVGDKLDEGWQATKELFGMGDEAATNIGKAADNIPCAVNSFSADTLVMTPTGAKPIAELAEGDLVLAYNETTGNIEVHPITATISHIDPEIVLLTIDGDPSTSSGTETLETTAEHPFYELESAPWLAAGQTEGHWTDALDLKAGDRIWQADGTSGVVQAVKVAPVPQRMYNLTVAEAHTFFVGEQQWLAHNAGPCELDPFKLNLSKTVQNHLNDITKQGAPARSYSNSRLLLQEIMEGGNPIADPGGLPSGLRWDVAGKFNGREGIWELVVDTETNTVVHFLFKGN